MSSIPFDWGTRRWVELHLTFELLNALPVPNYASESGVARRVVEIAGRLAALLPPQVKGAAPEIAQAQAQAKAQMGQLAQALAAAKAEIAALKQDRAHVARRLEIEAFEAETNRMRAVGPLGGAQPG